jgi:tetratricopeptide (TPR) repeat protein
VLRLGIQWGQDAVSTADLFIALADARLLADSPGEAIGLLRRALTLGAAKASVLSKLARAFALCKRYLAAAVCLEDALAAGVDPSALEDIRVEIEQILGAAWTRLRERT